MLVGCDLIQSPLHNLTKVESTLHLLGQMKQPAESALLTQLVVDQLTLEDVVQVLEMVDVILWQFAQLLTVSS
jgi:hypothetical protein